MLVLFGLVASLYAVNALAETIYHCPTPAEVDNATKGKFQYHAVNDLYSSYWHGGSSYWDAPGVAIQKDGLTFVQKGEIFGSNMPQGPYTTPALPDVGRDTTCYYFFDDSSVAMGTTTPKGECQAVQHSDNLTFSCN